MIRVVWAVVFILVCSNGVLAEAQSNSLKPSATQITTSRSVKVNNYGNFHFNGEGTNDKSRIVQTLAQRDNICFTEFWPVSPAEIKAINPAAKVYRLYDLMLKTTWDFDWSNPKNTSALQTPLSKEMIDSNDWWLRDGDGTIVSEKDGNQYLDVGKPGFKEAYLEAVLRRNTGKGFDGFVFDYCHPIIKSNYFAYSGGWFNSHPMPVDYPTDDEWFNKAWKPFLKYVMDGLHKAGYKVIGNCIGEYGYTNSKEDFQRSVMDGVIYEQWAVDWPEKNGEWLPGHVIERRIRSLANDPLEVWTGDYGLMSSLPDYDQKQRVGLAMYYMGVPSSQEKRSYHHMKSREVYWEPLWDFFIGTPAESAVKMSGKYFWSRKFTNGIVLLNYDSSQTVNYVLDRKYKDINGQSYTGSVSVKPHTAMILTVN